MLGDADILDLGAGAGVLQVELARPRRDFAGKGERLLLGLVVAHHVHHGQRTAIFAVLHFQADDADVDPAPAAAGGAHLHVEAGHLLALACGVVGLAAAPADDAAPVRMPAEDVIALCAHDIPGLEAEQLLSRGIPGDDALVAVDDVGAVGGAVQQFTQEFLVGHAFCSYILWPGGRR